MCAAFGGRRLPLLQLSLQQTFVFLWFCFCVCVRSFGFSSLIRCSVVACTCNAIRYSQSMLHAYKIELRRKEDCAEAGGAIKKSRPNHNLHSLRFLFFRLIPWFLIILSFLAFFWPFPLFHYYNCQQRPADFRFYVSQSRFSLTSFSILFAYSHLNRRLAFVQHLFKPNVWINSPLVSQPHQISLNVIQKSEIAKSNPKLRQPNSMSLIRLRKTVNCTRINCENPNHASHKFSILICVTFSRTG